MPKLKTKVENLDIRRRGQVRNNCQPFSCVLTQFPLQWISQTIISATQSRKKQQTELVRSVLFAEKDKKRQENNNDDDDGDDDDDDDDDDDIDDDDDGDGDDDDSDDIPITVS